MAERRPLVAGVNLSPVDPTLERKFVFGEKTDAPTLPTHAEPREAKGQTVTRVPLTTRMRADFASALKRASLERQLSGQFPNSLQDILEEALEPWLKTNGYLK